MEVAHFRQESGWGGRKISYEKKAFTLVGHGEIKAGDIVLYDGRGFLEFPNQGLRRFVYQSAKAVDETDGGLTEREKSSVAGLVLAIIGFLLPFMWLIGLFVSFSEIRKASRRGEKSTKSVIGLIISIVGICASVSFLVVISKDGRDALLFPASSAPTKYVDAHYGFTIDVPAGMRQVKPDPASDDIAYHRSWAFDHAKPVTLDGGTYLEMLIVLVRERPETLTRQQVATQTRAFRAKPYEVAALVQKQGKMINARAGKINGRDALLFDVDCSSTNDKTTRLRQAYLIDEECEYLLYGLSRDSNWDLNAPRIDALIRSFTLKGSEPASDATTGS